MKGSRRTATHAGSITQAVNAISCCSLERGGPVLKGSATGLLSAAGITPAPTVGSSRGRLLESACAVVPWLALVPVVAEWLGKKHRAEGWAVCGSGHRAPCKKRLGSESCLWRRRGLLEPSQIFPKFSEPRAGGASIPLKRYCSLTTCLLLGSFCPAHASPSVSADCSEPTQEGRSSACRVASRRGRPGDLCMSPRTCCLNVLAHGVPECLAGRIDRPDTLRAFPGSWCAGLTPLREHRPKVGLPSHSAPQPLLETSVVTTFLLCAVSRITPRFSQKGSLQRARADTQVWVTVTRWRPWSQAADGNPLLQPELDGPHVKQTQLKYRQSCDGRYVNPKGGSSRPRCHPLLQKLQHWTNRAVDWVYCSR